MITVKKLQHKLTKKKIWEFMKLNSMPNTWQAEYIFTQSERETSFKERK